MFKNDFAFYIICNLISRQFKSIQEKENIYLPVVNSKVTNNLKRFQDMKITVKILKSQN